MSKTKLELTAREVEALYTAMRVFEDSYAGWSHAGMGSDVVQDLKAVARIFAKLELAEENK
jgi:hypothetical protein